MMGAWGEWGAEIGELSGWGMGDLTSEIKQSIRSILDLVPSVLLVFV